MKSEPFIYKLKDDSDDSMFVLYLVLTDKSRSDGFVPFLENINCVRICGNMVNLTKENENVHVAAEEYVFPNMPVLTIKIIDLIVISKEFRRYEELGAEKITISVNDDDKVSITGN